jgi:superfamily II helicase
MIISILFVIAMIFFVWASNELRRHYREQKAEQTKVCPKCMHIDTLTAFDPQNVTKYGFEMKSYICPACGGIEAGYTAKN